jgi:hypothetical protein
MDAKDFITDIQVGMKGLQEFEVQITVPKDFAFYGTVPYHMHIVNNIALVTVPASSVEEATRLAQAYFDGSEEDEDW